MTQYTAKSKRKHFYSYWFDQGTISQVHLSIAGTVIHAVNNYHTLYLYSKTKQ